MVTLVMFPSGKWPRKEKHPIEQMGYIEASNTDCSLSENGHCRRQQAACGLGGDSFSETRVIPKTARGMLLPMPELLVIRKTELEWKLRRYWPLMWRYAQETHDSPQKSDSRECILISTLKDFSTLFIKSLGIWRGHFNFLVIIYFILWEKWSPWMIFTDVGFLLMSSVYCRRNSRNLSLIRVWFIKSDLHGID